MNKVPRVDFRFWITKICATTLGETAGDLLSMTLALGYAASSVLLLGLFVCALYVQFQAAGYRPARYWSVVLLTSTGGTTLADFLNRSLALGYARGALLLTGLLVAALVLWRVMEGQLAVDRVERPRTEAFYWAAILCSNTLGTSLGDYLADDSGLGFAGGAGVIGATLALLAAARRWTSVDRVLLFWAAFVLTRPFGATFGDWLTKPVAHGGLALGTAGASSVLFGLLLLSLWSASGRVPRKAIPDRQAF